MQTPINIKWTLAGVIAIGMAALCSAQTAVESDLVSISGMAAANRRGQNDTSSAHRRDTWLRISAFTDAPLARADVAVYDTAGRSLFSRAQATNNQGVFPARIHNLPQDFRVTLTWDGFREQDLRRVFHGRFTLSADVQNFDPVHGIVYVNPVTTIVSRLLDRFPRLNLDQAQALVRRFLGLPANASLGAALREGKYFKSRYFSQKVFLAEAAKYGGVEPYIEVLLTHLRAQPESTHSFAAAPSSVLGGALNFVADNLAKGALSWAAGQGLGWVAKSAGLITPGATAADIANLQASLADLQSSVDELSKQLQALTQQVLAQLTQTQYNTIAVPALALAAQVNGVESDLTFFNQGCPAFPEDGADGGDASAAAFCTSQKATIIAELNDVTINHSYETFSAYLLDNPTVGFKGMIHLMSQSVGQSVGFFRPADSTKIQNMFNYWDSVQTQAANLKVELLHLNGAQDNPGGIAQLTSFLGDVNANPPKQGTLQNTHDSTSQLVFPPVPTGTVIQTKDHTMWATDYAQLPFPSAAGVCYPRDVPGAATITWGVGGYYPPNANFNWKNLPGWQPPSVDQMRALVDGGGASPMNWLINQTKAVAPDSPVSAGFPNILGTPVSCPVKGPYVWTNNPTGVVWFGFPVYYRFSMNNASVASDTNGATGFYYNWLYLVRGLPRDEQYYWYP